MRSDYEIVSTQFHYDQAEDRLIVKRTQDVESVIEMNKLEANTANTNWKGELHKVASIPMVIIEKYKNEKGVDLLNDSIAMKKFLNDPDNKFLRTKNGRL